jgi:uncharacterized phage infection (PIP) family protein YhgE
LRAQDVPDRKIDARQYAAGVSKARAGIPDAPEDSSDLKDMAAEIRLLRAQNQSFRAAQAEAQELAQQHESQLLSLHEDLDAKLSRVHDLEKTLVDRDAEVSKRKQREVSWQEHVRKRDKHINQLQEQVQQLHHASQRDKSKIDDLIKEREQAAANDLKMDVFDSSVDRASEAQLVSAVEDINSSIDEFVSTILDEAAPLVTAHPSVHSEASRNDGSILLLEALRLTPGGEEWGLLLDCLLHQRIVEVLHRGISPTSFGVPLPSEGGSEGLIKLYDVVSKTGKSSS